MRGYDFADEIVVSDGGSTDGSIEMLEKYPKVKLFHYENYEIVNGERWNPDNMHINFLIKKVKEFHPDWVEYDDVDELPKIFELICSTCGHKLSFHGFWVSWATNKVFPSQCTQRCGCEKFQYMKGKYLQDSEHEFYE